MVIRKTLVFSYNYLLQLFRVSLVTNVKKFLQDLSSYIYKVNDLQNKC